MTLHDIGKRKKQLFRSCFSKLDDAGRESKASRLQSVFNHSLKHKEAISNWMARRFWQKKPSPKPLIKPVNEPENSRMKRVAWLSMCGVPRQPSVK